MLQTAECQPWKAHRDLPGAGAISTLIINTASVLGGKLEVEASGSMLVSELKEAISHRLNLTPRKSLTLRWWGTPMADSSPISEYNISDKGQVQMSLQTRTQKECEALGELKQVRVRPGDGPAVVIQGLSASSTAKQLKRAILERKLFGVPSNGAVEEAGKTIREA